MVTADRNCSAVRVRGKSPVCLFCSLCSIVGLLSSSLPGPYEEAPALVTREISGQDIFM